MFPSHTDFTYSIGTIALEGGFMIPELNVTEAVPGLLFILEGNVYVPRTWNGVVAAIAMFQAPSSF